MDQQHQIPSEKDILLEINNFNNIRTDHFQIEPLESGISSRKIQNFIEAKLTPETVKILSSINFDHFKKSPMRLKNSKS
jgi:hypothetical protein